MLFYASIFAEFGIQHLKVVVAWLIAIEGESTTCAYYYWEVGYEDKVLTCVRMWLHRLSSYAVLKTIAENNIDCNDTTDPQNTLPHDNLGHREEVTLFPRFDWVSSMPAQWHGRLNEWEGWKAAISSSNSLRQTIPLLVSCHLIMWRTVCTWKPPESQSIRKYRRVWWSLSARQACDSSSRC